MQSDDLEALRVDLAEVQQGVAQSRLLEAVNRGKASRRLERQNMGPAPRFIRLLRDLEPDEPLEREGDFTEI